MNSHFSVFFGLFFNPSTHQIADVQVQVSQNTEALQGAQMEKGDLARQIQALEIELASQQSLVSMNSLYCFIYDFFLILCQCADHFQTLRAAFEQLLCVANLCDASVLPQMLFFIKFGAARVLSI